MRPSVIGSVVAILLTVAIVAQQSLTPGTEDSLQPGKVSFGAAKYPEAIVDLRAAANAALGSRTRQAFVESGKLDTLATLEEALIYLAIAHERLGQVEEARATIFRLLAAERIAPTFAALRLDPEVAEIEALATRYAPAPPLPANLFLAAESSDSLQRVTEAGSVAETQGALPRVVAVQPSTAAAREALLRELDEGAAYALADRSSSVVPGPSPFSANAERLRIERETAERIAAEIRSAQSAAEQQLAAERAASQKEADAKIAAARAVIDEETARRSAAQRAAIEKETAERIAAQRAAAQRAIDTVPAVEQAAPGPSIQERVAAEREAARREAELRSPAGAHSNMDLKGALGQADALARSGRLSEATAAFTRISAAPGASRDLVGEAAAGLYRTGSYAEAVRAFHRLEPFVRGEEDLRYYYAVSLYESGDAVAARRELACAIPFLEITDEVDRYRRKIESTTVALMSRHGRRR